MDVAVAPLRGRTRHGHAERHRDHRHDDGVPPPRHEGGLPIHHRARRGTPNPRRNSSSPSSTCSRTSPRKGFESGGDPISATLREMDLWGIEKALITRRRPVGHRRPGDAAASRPLHRLHLDGSQRRDGGHQPHRAGVRDVRRARRRRVPGRDVSPGSPSTTRRCTRSTPSASSSTSRSSAAPASPGRASRRPVNTSSSSTRSCSTSPNSSSSPVTGANPGPSSPSNSCSSGRASTSRPVRSRPKYYPQDIINYANTRGADKIIYAGYFPMGLSLERIMREMPAGRLQGRRVAQVPPHQRVAGARAGRVTDRRTYAFRCVRRTSLPR